MLAFGTGGVLLQLFAMAPLYRAVPLDWPLFWLYSVRIFQLEKEGRMLEFASWRHQQQSHKAASKRHFYSTGNTPRLSNGLEATLGSITWFEEDLQYFSDGYVSEQLGWMDVYQPGPTVGVCIMMPCVSGPVYVSAGFLLWHAAES